MSQLQSVQFHEDTIYCLEYQGEPFAPVKPIVENMGMEWSAQAFKLRANKERWSVEVISTISPKGVVNITTPSSEGVLKINTPSKRSEGGEQNMLCMPVRKLPAFFASISPNKVKPELRGKIIQYQNECDEALWQYWINGKAERENAQPTPANSANAPITPDQQCTLQAIAKQRILAINDKFDGRGGAYYPKLWGMFNNHFRLAKYSQLPQSQMSEAIAYLMTVDIIEEQLALEPAKPVQQSLPIKFSGVPTSEQIQAIYQEYISALDEYRRSIEAINRKHDREITLLAHYAVQSVFAGKTALAGDSFIDTMLSPLFELKYRYFDGAGKVFENLHRNMQLLRTLTA